MIKSTLLKLRTLNATPQMMKKAKLMEKKVIKRYGGSVTAYEYGLFLRCQTLSGILKISLFLPEDMRKGMNAPAYNIYVNPQTNDFITWIVKAKKWSNAKIDMLDLPNHIYYSTVKRIWVNQEGEAQLKRTLKVKKADYQGILEFQYRVRKEQLLARQKKETDPWDADMELIQELPKDWLHFVKKEAITENFIFYEYTKNGAKTGYCSFCEKDVPISKPRHNLKDCCPVCNKEIRYKASGKISCLVTKTECALLLQEIDKGFVVRTFSVYRKYNNDYSNPKDCVYEFDRDLYQGGKEKGYHYSLYKNQRMRWNLEEELRGYRAYYRGHEGMVYHKNLKELCEKHLKESALYRLLSDKPSLNVVRFLEIEKDMPALEQIIKAGLEELAADVVNRNFTESDLRQKTGELSKMLGIDNARLKRLREMHGGDIVLSWLKDEKEQNTIYKDCIIKGFSEERIYPHDLREFRKFMSVEKIFNYLKKQRQDEDSLKQTLTIWKDYLNMVNKAGMRIEKEQIYKPTNLKRMQSEVILLLQKEGVKKLANEISKKFKKVDEHCKPLTKYEYADENFSIIAPKGIVDIVQEGMALQHCIHTCDYYFERIQLRETFLLFLRKTGEENIPWYTLEVEPGGNIRQKRTTGDNQKSDLKIAYSFLKKWQKVIKDRLTNEDFQLAKKSNEMRKKEIAQLYKEGKQVWNGPLKGKLLAEVLENDFMPSEDIAM